MKNENSPANHPVGIEHTEQSNYEKKFSGIGRLLGTNSYSYLQQSHVMIIGVGGVGSWAAESLARSGIGILTLVDLDDVCVTNVNRHLPALDSTVGHEKATILKNRIIKNQKLHKRK